MKRRTRILAILLSFTLMMTMTVPFAFADDTAQTSDVETLQDESVVIFEEPVEDTVQSIDEATGEEAAATEEATEGTQNDVATEGFAIDEEEDEEAQPEEEQEPEIIDNHEKAADLGINSKVAADLKAKGFTKSVLIAGLDAGNRADVILIFCLNETKHEGKLFSVSRETFMQLNNDTKYNVDGKIRDFAKCDQASEFGNMAVLAKEMNRHLDLNITQYIGINWQGVADLADAMGGIDGNITSTEMLNQINGLIGKKAKHITHTGDVRLFGWQAVEYLRVRKHDGNVGSLRREDRGRKTFKQLFDRARSMSWIDVLKVYAAVADDIQTNMTVAEIKDNLRMIVAEQGGNVTVTNVFNKDKGSVPAKYTKMWDADGLYYYYVPNTLKSNVVSMHKSVFGQNKYKVSSTVTSLDKKIKTAKKKTLKKKQPTIAGATVKLSASSIAYTGQPITPDATVSMGGRTFVKGQDYTLEYSKNINPGTATVKVVGIGVTYDDQSKSVTFNILPPTAGGLRLESAAAKSFTATWDQATGPVDGYQVQYGLKSSFKKAKSKNVKGIATASLKVKKLKSKKKYYVRVRTYVTTKVKKGKKTKTVTIYSGWSSSESVVTN